MLRANVGRGRFICEYMDRLIVSPPVAGRPHEAALNPPLLYLDTSVWIEMFQAYSTAGHRIIDDIVANIGGNSVRVLVSIVNFLELIGRDGDISRHFSPEEVGAIDYVRIISARPPGMITHQEVWKFLGRKKHGIRIFDPSQLAIASMARGSEERKRGDTSWLMSQRRWWDDVQERDRTLDLHADIYELSGIRPSGSQVIMQTKRVLNASAETVREKKSDLLQIKQRYKGKKHVPPEQSEVLSYASNRLTASIARKYGEERFAMLTANPFFVFPGHPNLRRDILRDLSRAVQLTFATIKRELPGLYWQAKVTYYNYYHAPQRSGGQSGDRNHAVYIPYCNYFGTCDRILVQAMRTECGIVQTIGNIHVFKTR